MTDPLAFIQRVGGVVDFVANDGFTRHTGTRPVVGTLDRTLSASEDFRGLMVYDGDTYLGRATVAGQHWAFSDRRLLNDGQLVSYNVRLGFNGSLLTSSSYRFTVDTSPPPAPTIESVSDDAGAVRGAVASGGTTDDTRLLVRVGLSSAHQAGGKLTLFDGTKALGPAVDLDTLDIQRGWKEIQTPLLQAGQAYQLKAGVTDVAGNQTVGSATHNVSIASTARSAPRIAGLIDDAGASHATLLSGSTTDDALPHIVVDLRGTNTVAGDRIRLLGGAMALKDAEIEVTTGHLQSGVASVGIPWGLADRTSHALHAVVVAVERQDLTVGGVTYPGLVVGETPGTPSEAFNITVDTRTPTIVRLSDDLGATGLVGEGGRTDDRAPTVRVGLWNTDARAGDTLEVIFGGRDPRDPMRTAIPRTHQVLLSADDIAAGYRDLVDLPVQHAQDTPLEGLFEVRARLAGRGVDGLPLRFTIDTTAPGAPTNLGVLDNVGAVQGAVADSGRTDDRELEFRVGLAGTGAMAGDSLLLSVLSHDGTVRVARFELGDDDVRLGARQVAVPRWFSVDGNYDLSARLIDMAGNWGEPSASTAFVLDTTAPNTPRIGSVTDDAGSVRGPVADEGVSNDTQLLVRVELEGTNAAVGDTVQLFDRTGSVSGSLMRSLVLTADDVDSRGYVDLLTTSLSGGTLATGGRRRYALEAQIVDVAGNQGAAAAHAVHIDTTAPGAPPQPSLIDDVGRVQGPLPGGGQTDDLTPVVRISLQNTSAAVGDSVQLLNDGAAIGAPVTLADVDIGRGYVDFSPALVVRSLYRFSARITDLAGNQGGDSPTYVVTAVAPLAPAPAIAGVRDDVGAVQGLVPSGGATDDTRVTLSVDLAASGAVEGDSLQVLSGAAVLGSTVLSGVTTPVPLTLDLQPGSYELAARILDSAGQARTEISASHRIVIDTTAPNAPSISRVVDDFGWVRTLSLDSGGTTDDLQPTVRVSLPDSGPGAARAGDTLQLRDDSTVLATVTLAAGDIEARFKEVETPVLAVDRGYGLNAVLIDAAGNAGVASATHQIRTVHRLIDAPRIGHVSDDVGDPSLVSSGGTTDDAHPTVRVELDRTNAQADDFIVLYSGADLLQGFVPVKLAPADIVARYKDVETPLLRDGAHSLTARILDSSGRSTADSTAHALTVDTQVWVPRVPPVITSVTDDVGPRQGTVSAGERTDDARPVVRVGLSGGTFAQPDDLVQLLADGSALGDAARIGVADIRAGFKDVESPLLGDGTYALSALIVDRAGNRTTASAAHTIIVDTTAPVVPRLSPTIESVFYTQGGQVFVVQAGAQTKAAVLSLKVRLTDTNAQLNDALLVYDGDAQLGGELARVLPADLAQGFKIVNVNIPANGLHALSAALQDGAGLRGPLGGAYALMVDTVAPNAPRITEVFDDVAGAVLAAGALTADKTLRVSVDIRDTEARAGDTLILRSGAQAPLLTVALSGDDIRLGFKQVTTPTLASGRRYELNAVVADLAGNWSLPSESQAVLIQQAPPRIRNVQDDVRPVNGISNRVANGGVTDDATPTLQLDLTDANASGGDAIVVFNRAGAEIASFVVTANEARQQWKDVTLPSLPEGTIGLRAAVRYGSGSSSSLSAASAEHTITVDTTAPIAPTIQGVAGGGQAVADGGRTNLNSSLRVTVGFDAPGNPVMAGDTLTLRSGSTVLLSTALTSDDVREQRKELLLPALVNGNRYELQALITDQAGNQSVASGRHSFTVNQLAPGILSVRDDQGLRQGALAHGATTDDARPTFRIGLRNTNARQGDSAVLFDTGSAIPGAEFTLTATDIQRGHKDVETALGDGSRQISAAIRDAQGQLSMPSAAFRLTIDTVAPAVAPAILGVFQPAAGERPLTATVSLGSAAQAGDTLTLRSGSTELVSEVLSEGDINRGSRQLTTPALVDGVYSLNALLTDRAGNRGSAGDAVSVEVDTTAPNAPLIVSVADDVGAVQGLLAREGVSDDTQLQVRVSLASSNAVQGDTLRLFDGTTALGAGVTLRAADIAAQYRDITTPTLSPGQAYRLNARITDQAANQSAASADFALAIDTAAPRVASVHLYAAGGKVLNQELLRAGDVVVAEIAFDSDLVLRRGDTYSLSDPDDYLFDRWSEPEDDRDDDRVSLPSLLFNIGGQTSLVELSSLSEAGSQPLTDKLTFRLMLERDQTSADEIWVGENALVLGSINNLQDPAGNQANTAHAWAGPGVKASYGTEADDRFVLSAADLQALSAGAANQPLVRIDGRGGIDTLRLVDDGMVLDLTLVAQKRLQGIERIDMVTPTGSNATSRLKLTAADVLDMSDSAPWAIDRALASRQLMVEADVDGGIELLGGGWQTHGVSSIGGAAYFVHEHAERDVQVLTSFHTPVVLGG